jgi:hypothetical protein
LVVEIIISLLVALIALALFLMARSDKPKDYRSTLPTPKDASVAPPALMRMSDQEQAMLFYAFTQFGAIADTHDSHQRMADLLGIDDVKAWSLLACGSAPGVDLCVLHGAYWHPTMKLKARFPRKKKQ